MATRKNVGLKLFSNAVLVIPKVLIMNAGYDVQDMIGQATTGEGGDFIRGLDLENGGILNPASVGIYDMYSAKKQLIDAR